MSTLNVDLHLTRAEFDWHAKFEVPAHGVIGVFGPSGSGKTTLLRCTAGLERARGLVRVGDVTWQDDNQGIWRDVAQRGVGMVFQDARLFPHLTVRGNLQYGYERTPVPQRRVQWQHALHVFGLEQFLPRRVTSLSAGEQQRVAMARALLASPNVLLMDEPLAALDVRRKREILPFIRRAAREFNIPVLLVSHTLQELLQVADSLLLLDRGKTVAAGELNDVLMHLHLLGYAEDFAGTVLETRVLEHEPQYQLTVAQFRGQRLYVPHRDVAVGDALRVFVLARNVSLALQPVTSAFSVLNVLEATVVDVRAARVDSAVVDVQLDVGVPLLASITRKSVDHLQLRPGQRVYAYIKAVSLEQEL